MRCEALDTARDVSFLEACLETLAAIIGSLSVEEDLEHALVPLPAQRHSEAFLHGRLATAWAGDGGHSRGPAADRFGRRSCMREGNFLPVGQSGPACRQRHGTGFGRRSTTRCGRAQPAPPQNVPLRSGGRLAGGRLERVGRLRQRRNLGGLVVHPELGDEGVLRGLVRDDAPGAALTVSAE